MPAGRGFDKARVMADIPATLPGGSTAMVEGLYRGWDELRSVANGQQSGLRVIVLFTDGASNSVPGIYPNAGSPTRGGSEPTTSRDRADPDGQTHANPTIAGLYDTQSGAGLPNIANEATPLELDSGAHAGAAVCRCWMPPTLPLQPSKRRNPDFVSVVTTTLMVDGSAQTARRPMREGRRSVGDTPLRSSTSTTPLATSSRSSRTKRALMPVATIASAIYTIGMGSLVRLQLGTRPENRKSMLLRIANDADAPASDRNPTQLEGNYYFAETGRTLPPRSRRCRTRSSA